MTLLELLLCSGLQSGFFLLSWTSFVPKTKGWKHMSHPCVQIQHICMHTRKHSMSLHDSYVVLIVTLGIQQFPAASLYGAFGCNGLAVE